MIFTAFQFSRDYAPILILIRSAISKHKYKKKVEKIIKQNKTEKNKNDERGKKKGIERNYRVTD